MLQQLVHSINSVQQPIHLANLVSRMVGQSKTHNSKISSINNDRIVPYITTKGRCDLFLYGEKTAKYRML